MLNRINIKGKNLILIGLGYQPNFTIIQRHIQSLKNQKTLWIYDKAKLDIAFHLAKSENHNHSITYITRVNFQTVHLKPKLTHLHINQQQIPTFDKVKDLIENYNFQIKSTFCDYHPNTAYTKLCKYMNVKMDKDDLSIFNLSFSDYKLPPINNFIPYMDEIRNQYLSNQGLKLRVLTRKTTASQEQSKQVIKKWKQHFHIDKIMQSNIQKVTTNDWINKLEWITKNNYGFQITKDHLLQGFGRKYSYASINDQLCDSAIN